MKKILALILCVLMPVGLFADEDSSKVKDENSYKVKYDGGSLPNLKSGAGMKNVIDNNNIRLVKDKEQVAVIPATAVTEISYGQDVHRRVGTAVAVGALSLGAGALVALSKSKKHFIGLTWTDGENKGGVAFQADKNDYRGLLAGLEGITGKKAVDSATMAVKN